MGDVSDEGAAQQVPGMFGVLYELLAAERPEATADQLRVAAMILEASGQAADKMDPVDAAELADVTAFRLRTIFKGADSH